MMNKEQLGMFIGQIKKGATNPSLIHLCESFEAFMALYASRNQERSNPEAFEKQLASSYRAMWDSFEIAADSCGIQGEKFLKQFVDKAELSPEWLEGINHLQQSLEAIEGPAPDQKGKKKTKQKEVRI